MRIYFVPQIPLTHSAERNCDVQRSWIHNGTIPLGYEHYKKMERAQHEDGMQAPLRWSVWCK